MDKSHYKIGTAAVWAGEGDLNVKRAVTSLKSLIRYSVEIENVDDLIDDLDHALALL